MIKAEKAVLNGDGSQFCDGSPIFFHSHIAGLANIRTRAMRFQLNGQFRVFDAAERDITPRGIKERGLLALLVLSPGQRRTRIWLQDKLWSDRSPEQASGSCRQALSNIRNAFGPAALHLQSDRSAVWIGRQ